MGFGTSNIWPNNKVSYKFQAGLVDPYREYYKKAIDAWESVSPIRFILVEEKHAGDVITLGVGRANQSGVGRGTYDVTLNPDYTSVGHAYHELGHAIGLYHEHQRPDSALFNATRGDLTHQELAARPVDCACVADARNLITVGAYDYKSVSHYPAGLSGLEPTIPGAEPGSWRMNNHPTIEAGDRWAMQLLYGRPDLKTMGTTKPYYAADMRYLFSDANHVHAVREGERVSGFGWYVDGDIIRSYLLYFTDGDGEERTSPPPGDTGDATLKTEKFDHDEHIIGIEGRCGSRIDRLEVHTNKKIYRYGGSGGVASFSYSMPKGAEIVGLAGHLSDDRHWMTSVGVIVRGRNSGSDREVGATAASGSAKGSWFTDDSSIRIDRLGIWVDGSGVRGLSILRNGLHKRHGGAQGTYIEVPLAPDEDVGAVYGAAWDDVRWLSFELRDRVTGAVRRTQRFGSNQGGELFQHDFLPGHGLRGFAGYASSDRIHGLVSLFGRTDV